MIERSAVTSLGSETPDPWARSRVLRLLLPLLLVLSTGCTATAPTPEALTPADVSTPSPAEPSTGQGQILVTLERRPSWEMPRAGSSIRRYGGRGDYEVSSRTRRVVEKLAGTYGMRRVDAWPIDVLDVHCVVFELDPGTDPEQLMDRLAEDPRVESVQPMHLFEVLGRRSDRTPDPGEAPGYDDPYFDLQHGIVSMQIQEAHRLANGRGVEVAVVDTGVDVSHPDLDDRILHAEDFVDDSRPFHRETHGTAIGGLIASVANNGIGIVGIAPDVRILALRACWERPEGAFCNSFTLAKALAFAVSQRPDILNLSLAGPSDPLLERLLRKATERGIIVIAARGTGLRSRERFPATVEEVLTVEAAESSPGDGSRAEVPGHSRLRAPSIDLLTTVPEGRYDFVSGSSFAAAAVTGVVALILERDRQLTAGEVFELLRDTSREVDFPGVGLVRVVNACTALSRVLKGEPCPPTPASRASAL